MTHQKITCNCSSGVIPKRCKIYARRMGQPTQRATNYTARSNIDTAQIFLHANGQRPNRAMIRQRSRRRQRRGEPHTEHGLGVLLRLYTHSHELPALTALAQHISHSHSGIDEKRPMEKFDALPTNMRSIRIRLFLVRTLVIIIRIMLANMPLSGLCALERCGLACCTACHGA